MKSTSILLLGFILGCLLCAMFRPYYAENMPQERVHLGHDFDSEGRLIRVYSFYVRDSVRLLHGEYFEIIYAENRLDYEYYENGISIFGFSSTIIGAPISSLRVAIGTIERGRDKHWALGQD